jgi:hypothetical protein
VNGTEKRKEIGSLSTTFLLFYYTHLVLVSKSEENIPVVVTLVFGAISEIIHVHKCESSSE